MGPSLRDGLGAVLVVSVILLSSSAGLGQLPPEKASLDAAADLRVEMFAHEPQLVCPSAFDVDEHGRVWVAEAVNYRGAAGKRTKEPPYFLEPFRKAGDRIVVLEDTDGDGKCDRSRVFAEGLDITAPKGIAVIGNKVWLSQSPNIVTIEINPDGTAGKKETVLTGFGGTHGDHSVHSVTLGPDGRLYGSFGDTGCDVKFPDGRRLVTDGKPWKAGCVFRMNLDLTGAEIVAHNFRNGYEVAVDSFGNMFLSDNDEDDGNQFCRLTHVMEGGNYGWQPYQKGFDWNLESPGVSPILIRTGAGAPAGLCVYEGTLLPEKYRGMPILAECGAGWVGGPRLAPMGAGYRVLRSDRWRDEDDPYEIRSPEKLLTSADRWFRPSDVAVGPDGSLFVADFYNHVAGGRDTSKEPRGRIYRILPKDGKGGDRVPKLDLDSPAGLLEALGSPNQARRARAILKIQEMGPKAVPILASLLTKSGFQNVHVDPKARENQAQYDRILKARAIFQLGRFGEQHVRTALKDADPEIRVVAVRTLTQHGADMAAAAKSLVSDPSPKVRRELMIALRQTDSGAARDVLISLANQYDGLDRYYLEAVGIACRGRDAAFTQALIGSWPKGAWDRRIAGLLWELGPPEALPLFTAIALDDKRDLSARQIAIDALGATDDPKAGAALARLVAEENPRELTGRSYARLARKLAGPWRGLGKNTDPFAAQLAEVALKHAKPAQQIPEALAVSRALGTRPLEQWMLSQPMPRVKKDSLPETVAAPEQLPDWTRARLTPDGALDIASLRSPSADAAAYASTLLTAKQEFATRLWVGNSAGLKIWLNDKLIHELDAGRPIAARQTSIPVTLSAGVNRLLVRADAAALGWAFVVELEDPLGRAVETTDQSLPKISAPASERIDPKKLPPDRELLALRGDADRGRQVFLRTKANCASCHKVSGEGGTLGVGPTLDGLGVKMSREAILAEMLRPSQSIGQQYSVWNVQTKDGKSVVGIVIDEQPDRLTLKDAQGKATTVAKKDIEERTRSEVSLMPELLVGEFTRQELADLLQYLAGLK